MTAKNEMTDEIKAFWNKVIVRGIENKQSQIIIGDTLSFIGDEPQALGGDGLGPNPFTLMLASLGL
ncbi:MAG: OsmC family protein [Nitrospinota bacterium]